MRVAVIILNHNKSENSDKLYIELSKVFTHVELWDSGSDCTNIPINVTHSFENIYWAGAWREVLSKYSNKENISRIFDAVWMIGGDIELLSPASEIYENMCSCYPFGIWSPSIVGRAHDFMLNKNFDKKPYRVKNIEGMAFALSVDLINKLTDIPLSKYGFGIDYLFCHRSRSLGLSNFIDGRCKVYHPADIGYDEELAHDEMENLFSDKFGVNFRNEIFEYDYFFDGNVLRDENMLNIITVTNGWGIDEFVEITSAIKNCRKTIVVKGTSSLSHIASMDGYTVLPYNYNLDSLIKESDIALFPKVCEHSNKSEYAKIVNSGLPVIVNASYNFDLIEHEKNGFLFSDISWGKFWLKKLCEENEFRESIRFNNIFFSKSESKKEYSIKTPLVSVITPTMDRNLEIIKRSTNCLLLQDETDWEQIICSNGKYEDRVEKLVKDINDSRVHYTHCEAPIPDWGNYARREVLKNIKGKYVFFLDDDNIIMPSYLSTMIRALEENDAEVALCKIIHFGPINEKVGKPPIVLSGFPVELYHIDPLQFLIKTSVMKDIGWDVDNGYCSDGHTLQKLKDRKIVEVPIVLGVHV